MGNDAPEFNNRRSTDPPTSRVIERRKNHAARIFMFWRTFPMNEPHPLCLSLLLWPAQHDAKPPDGKQAIQSAGAKKLAFTNQWV